jgi:hypothetical protein
MYLAEVEANTNLTESQATRQEPYADLKDLLERLPGMEGWRTRIPCCRRTGGPRAKLRARCKSRLEATPVNGGSVECLPLAAHCRYWYDPGNKPTTHHSLEKERFEMALALAD